MHLLIIFSTLSAAYLYRYFWTPSTAPWGVRWHKTLFAFLFPPLLIFMTAIALLYMGPQGQMGGIQTGCLSYVISLGYLAIFAVLCIKLARQGWQSVKLARSYPLVNIGGKNIRLLTTKSLFAGQIGFWQPELVVSEGLLETLSEEHLATVFAHEQGHYHYRDTFWFFWLGWIRNCTAWLPQSHALWQELLVLRELRADAYAAAQVDRILLAESLLYVASTPFVESEICCAALGSSGVDRLEQRIEALLGQSASEEINTTFSYGLLLAFLPLITVVFHS
ncbi:M56 family metallopeptidase [Calothrix sp. 336/3]|uniref:M56 family metallopeptidase n=1 Tax=Calothrix sp. 336/3 TaxID=1337936 RepID=UPI0004E2EABE|nr:M56 family metallopeptidase [Calothrix sp. 336/3]AKG20220.1 peptidase M56 BlaR1 [Calothrix sp. 336/3]